MAFPTSPSKGDTYVFEGVTYTWNGFTWRFRPVNADGGAGNEQSYSGPFGTDRELDDLAQYRGQGDGGYEFTGGFADRTTGSTGNLIGDNVQYTSDQAEAGIWRRFGFSSAQQVINDNEYWGETNVAFYQSKGLFGGMHMPHGVTDLFDFDDTSLAAAVTSGDLQYTAANGSYNFKQCRVGDLAKVRFSFMVTPQQANTTIEVGLIWATRNENDEVTFTFPLLTQPIYYGTGTVGKAFLNRVEMSAYFASDEDINARVLPAIRSDNEVLVKPLTTLCTIVR